MKNICVSIVTACFDSELTIARTIESVLHQTYENVEYIIIDGKSTDRTLEIVENYKPLFGERMKVISEPDQGIYDAMNKGILHASGDLIGILNSDDYYETDTVENIVSAMQKDKYQILYGMMRILNNGIETKITMPKHENLRNEMIAHPTCFVTKDVYEDFGMFDTKYRSCADHDFMLRMSEHKDIHFVPVYKILATFTEGTGMSSKGSSMMEAFGMLKEHGIISEKEYRSISLSYHLKKILKFGKNQGGLLNVSF